MTAADLCRGWFYHNGALRLASSLGWGLQMLKEDAVRLGLHDARAKLQAAWTNLPPQAQWMPYAEHPAIVDEGLPSYVRDWFEHDAPGEYWTAMDISERAKKIAVPALHVSGWYDTYLEGSVAGFELLREKSPAREQQYLLAGPWVHIPWGDRGGEMQWSDAALLDTDALLLRWFDHWLKDAGTWDDEPRVRHFALGANQWCRSESCQGAAEKELYLHSAGRAESRKGDGVLSEGAPQDEPADMFVYDPEVPVVSPAPGMDQAAMEMGNNLLVYTGAALTEPLHVFGRPKVELYAKTSAAHADLTAKLVRVLASGRAEFCCIGIARSSALFADYKPDKVQRWVFTLEPTSTVFAAGERVRLEVAGGAFPLYDRNPSNATNPPQMSPWNWGRSTHTVLHDAQHPSAVTLPVTEVSA
jgi:putative CocE/NonD family hydrolase